MEAIPNPQRLVIIGGVAGGAAAAARARRLSESAEIVLLERGEHVSFANCGLPYHIGGAIADRSRLLVMKPELLRRRLRIDVRTRTEAVAIDRERRVVHARNLATGAEESISYDALILSPGAEPIRPALPGGDAPRVLTLRNLADMDAIKKIVDEERPGRAVIAGGGYIGLEMAEALRRREVPVTLVERASQVMAPADPEMAAPLHAQLRLHGVDLRLETSITAVVAQASSLQCQSRQDACATPLDGALIVSLSTGETVEAGLLLMAIGVRPESRLAREAGLALGERGGILVDEHLRTSDPAIWAVGDAVQVTDFVSGAGALIPLAGPANRMGRIAADNVFGRASTYKKTQGTAICKVFDLAIAMTGLSEKAARAAGLPHETIHIHPASHAGYYPGASPMTLKLVFDPGTGKILGAQAVGADGVDKRIDVLATALRAGLTVYDLEDLELSYAPPYGSARDPVNVAGFVAANVLRGDVRLCHAADINEPREDQVLLDVRNPAELAAGTIPGAINIPLDELRARLDELPRDKELLVFCQVGARGYLACRTLTQHGLACRNLNGGYKTWSMAYGHAANEENEPREMRDDSGDVHADPSETKPRHAASGARPVTSGGSDLRTIDATALQCPGPIMRLAEELAPLDAGARVAILARDPGFAADVAAWCHSTGNRLLGLGPENGHIRATIEKGERAEVAQASSLHPEAGKMPASPASKKKTIVVFSGDYDRCMAALIIANGAAAMGSQVTLFFTFWGLNALRRPETVSVKKNLIEKMFGWMMPRGAGRLKLSRMNMGGMGLAMIKGIMRKKNVSPLPELIAKARAAGVRLVACAMSMDLMGIKYEEMIEGVELGGVAMYLNEAESGTVNLFV